MRMNEVPLKHKALIGAAGGFCLVLLKLIDAGFYVDDFFSKQAIVGYFTYLAYLIIGTIAAVVLSEHDVSKEKVRKSAFIVGLLGPSILIAILKQPVVPTQPITDLVPDIPKISRSLISPAHAQTRDVPAAPGSATSVQILKKEAVEPSFKEVLLTTIGRPVPIKDHVYVVGVAESESKAIAAAAAINEKILVQKQGLQAQVFKPEGMSKYYVTVGGLKEPGAAIKLGAAAQAIAIKTLKEQTDEASKRAATLLIGGKVVDGKMLFK